MSELLKHKVPSIGTISLQFLNQQVVSRSHLVVFVVQNVSNVLLVTLSSKLLGQLRKYLIYYWYFILADNYAMELSFFILGRFDLLKPIMVSDALDSYSTLRVSVQDLLDKVFAVRRDKAWQQIVAGQNLLVKLIGIRIFKGQIATRHRVEDDSA